MWALLCVIASLAGNAQADAAWLDLGGEWRFQADPADAGMEAGWQRPDFDDEAWASIEAGKRWEDQDYAEVDGYAWYRRTFEIPAAWEGKNAWLVLGGVNDACTLFCNGNRVASYGDHTETTVCDTPLIADLTPWLRQDSANVLAIRCYDWGASGGLWRLPCALTTDSTRLLLDQVVATQVDHRDKTISLDVDLAGLGNDRPDTRVTIAAYRPDREQPVATASVVVSKSERRGSTAIRMPKAADGDVYRVEVAIEAPGAPPVRTTREVAWPGRPRWPAPYDGLRVRNNFVTELLREEVESAGEKTCVFGNPRDGWVFVTAGCEAGAPPRLWLDTESDPLVWRINPDSGSVEAMRLITEGQHHVRMVAEKAACIEIRTVPEIAFCYYPSGRHIQAFPAYDWAYMERYVLSHVNTLVSGNRATDDEFAQWLGEGRQWIANAALPGLSSKEAPSADDVFAAWAANQGVTDPGFSGLMVDEFYAAGEAHYRAWSEAVQRLHDLPAFAGRHFYAWCTDLYLQAPSLEFSRLLMTLGERFSWERYVPEEPTVEKARQRLLREMQFPFEKWREHLPGVERNMVVCLGYLCAPPETLNLNPGVDYHVFLDMQFNLLANDPTFWGLYGVMEYMAAYADEESIRWAHRLFRHYGIEGHTEPLVESPYAIEHIKNPDFADGLQHWRVDAAAPDSVGIGQMKGFSWLQGRYPTTRAGDQYCVMRRSADRPNRVSQKIRALKPGATYSVKVLSADPADLAVEKKTGLSIEIEGGDVLDPLCFQYPYPSCYSHEEGPYNRDHPAWFNFHRVVFRAKGRSAEIVLSDWTTPGAPGDQPGGETAFNFVEIQPFLMP
ncbi:MAG TPA: hypothetical protein PLO37_04385 [Candidatus Hydrogenedentes bacterium]|nr:hypothetical protein [Candidatus Hydrogenedentota bacterium]HPG66063.1 hypothetical protein [Candidatus Hydrogenedentota bacterium]